MVQATLGIATAVLEVAALSFLGLGVQPPTAEWGSMLAAERNNVFTAFFLVLFPGIMIMINVLAFNLLGDGLRDALDPEAQQVTERQPLLEIAGLRTWFFTGDGVVKAVDGVDLTRGQGRGARARRRVGVRQERDDVLGAAARGPARSHRRAARCASTASTCWRCPTKELREHPRRPHHDGVPAAELVAQPVLPRRRTRSPRSTASTSACGRPSATSAPSRCCARSASPTRAAGRAPTPTSSRAGMAQRVMIAMALAAGPELLIADEPTTALDVTIQAQILDLMAHLRYELGMAMVLITHDLGVVAEMAERVAVMYAGQIVEETTTPALFRRPAAPVHARA